MHPLNVDSYLPGIAKSLAKLKGTGARATHTYSNALFSKPARKPVEGGVQVKDVQS